MGLTVCFQETGWGSLLSAAHPQAGHARLTAATALHFGDFLNAVPCSAVGTRLDGTSSLRLAIVLHLGAIMCACTAHMCLWGSNVIELLHMHHAHVSKVMWRSKVIELLHMHHT